MNSSATPTRTDSTGTPPPKLFHAVSSREVGGDRLTQACGLTTGGEKAPPRHNTSPDGQGSHPQGHVGPSGNQNSDANGKCDENVHGPPPAEGDCNGRSRHSKRGRTGRNVLNSFGGNVARLSPGTEAVKMDRALSAFRPPPAGEAGH